MKRIYLAGPYSADNVMDVLKNIRSGIQAATEVLSLGYAPFCPWLDYQFVLMDKDDKITLQDFYDYSLAWLAVSDAIILIGDWTKSKGALKEFKYAKKHNIRFFYGMAEFKREVINNNF